MNKRAVIYVRVSSEKQAEKVSPQEQEELCKKLANDKGYEIIDIYRDIERYRVRGKLVEPSGTRSDRPALRRMIADGKNGAYDVILAWREDRLYRGFRPMLDVLELIEEHKIVIELATEFFDSRMAPVKAWAAKMELDAIKERMHMGKVGRLKQGKMIGGPGTGFLGYDILDGVGVINEREAEIVRFIFEQVAWGDQDNPAGIPIKEIRRRLIIRGYSQKNDTVHQIPWARGVIYSILHCETYLGKMTYHVNGDTYDVPFPPLIDQETFDRAQENMASHKRYPVRNVRELGFLLVGKVYGPCGHRMDYRINRYGYYKRVDGTKVRYDRPKPLAYGMCSVSYEEGQCNFHTVVRLMEIEQAVWDKIAPFLLDPQNIKMVAAHKVKDWVQGREQYKNDVDRLESHLAKLREERHWVITQARKGNLSDDDMAEQLSTITQEELESRRELSLARQAFEAGEDLLKMVNELATFLQEFEGELIELSKVPIHTMDIEQRRKVQRWFDAVVTRVNLMEGDAVEIQTDVFGLLHTMTNWSTMSHRR